MSDKYGPSITNILPNTNRNLCLAHHVGDGEVHYEPIIGWIVQVIQKDVGGEVVPWHYCALPFSAGCNLIDVIGVGAFVYDRSTGEWSQADGDFGIGEASFIESYERWTKK